MHHLIVLLMLLFCMSEDDVVVVMAMVNLIWTCLSSFTFLHTITFTHFHTLLSLSTALCHVPVHFRPLFLFFPFFIKVR